MSNGQGKLKKSEIESRNWLKKKKPYVYEKIMRYDEKVRKGESIAIIQFQYDYTCNFKCEHCSVKRFQGKKEGRCFTIEDVKELSRQADEMGLAHFVITGGEPLVFPDLDELIKAIDPQKFHICCDTNGWLLDYEKAKHLKKIGVDKIQLSIDSLSVSEHEKFRGKKESHKRAIRAIDAALKAGLKIMVQTVVTKQRVRSKEFIDFLKCINGKGVPVFVTYAKPVGAWEGNFECLVDKSDMDYVRELEKKYKVYTHLTPAYGLNLGCIAVGWKKAFLLGLLSKKGFARISASSKPKMKESPVNMPTKVFCGFSKSTLIPLTLLKIMPPIFCSSRHRPISRALPLTLLTRTTKVSPPVII